MKKASAPFLFIAPALLLSCAQNAEGSTTISPSESGEEVENKPVQIQFLCMVNDNYRPTLESIIDSFEEQNPHINVVLVNPKGSGSYANIEKVVISGFFEEDYPDIVQCYPDNAIKYIAQGYAIDADRFLNDPEVGLSEEERKDYIGTFLEEGANYPNAEGTYSLPFCKSTELMYYNASKLLGLDLSSYDASINQGEPLDAAYLDQITWEDLFDHLCPALEAYNNAQAEDEKIYVQTENTGIVTYDSDENFFITLAEQYGYGYTSVDENHKGKIDFNNDSMKGIVKWLNQAKNKHYLNTRYGYKTFVSGLFQRGESLFTISSNAGLAYNFNRDDPFEIGVAHIPHPEGKDYMSINQGPSVCLLDHKDDHRALASYLLWRHLTNAENSSKWALATGYMGIRSSSYQTEAYQEAIANRSDLLAQATSDNLQRIAEIQDSTFNTAVFRGSSNVRTNVGLLLRDCLNSQDIDNDIDGLFDKYYGESNKFIR